MNSFRLTKSLVLFVLICVPIVACSDKLVEQRTNFLLAEKYLAENNENEFLKISTTLEDYPLYPYLRYQWLKTKLAQTGLITSFLADYKTSRFAELLRAKWLDYLAEQHRWLEFIQHYQQNDHSGDDCRWQWAKHQTDQTTAALAEAKRLWLLGENRQECHGLFTALLKSTSISPELIWQRFEVLLNKNNPTAARQTALLLAKSEQAKTTQWLQLHEKPHLLEDNRYWQVKDAQTSRLFAHAISRLVNTDLDRAMWIWDAKFHEFTVDNPTIQIIEKKFGKTLLSNKDNRAYSRFSKINSPDDEVRIGKVRAALLEQNWQHVITALNGLSPSEQQEPKWQYWRARALEQSGNKHQALGLFNDLALDRSFYGYVAAEKVNKPYHINDQPVKVEAKALESLLEDTDFKVCSEFKFFNRDLESRRQWQYAIKKLPREKLLVAAKLAQQWQWHQLAITTLVKADYWDDIELRFPILYLNDVQTNAHKYSLDPALILGLMRQESMMDSQVVSGAGAMGLMQLMPKTARNIAHQQQLAFVDRDLFNPAVNINYGSYYLRDLSGQFGGHFALIAAAYNAGPNRAKKWLPSQFVVPADIWMETIPYQETRKYVSNILANAIIYQSRLNKSTLKLTSLLRDIPAI
jgi:soluble lytic murein transglycosylase